jgi:hypothetical protein
MFALLAIEGLPSTFGSVTEVEISQKGLYDPEDEPTFKKRPRREESRQTLHVRMSSSSSSLLTHWIPPSFRRYRLCL